MNFEIISKLQIKNDVVVTVKGADDSLSIGTAARDENGMKFTIKSIGLVRHKNPNDIFKTTELLLAGGDARSASAVGKVLTV